ncbi:uncharacterized protein RSE6_04104 [Rhynchosporium secalis]|uniref:Extracellular membrane protein CFEM domain-containing protein n=1 Tax=Rhynchosporium secalis TaxID=38038 RepID=A0A1E1M4F4_RHYSE|nr:uncharacterized protein RSE6_04104 [Rhynchosporium secalis]
MKVSQLLWLAIAASSASAKIKCPDMIFRLQKCCPGGLLQLASYNQIIAAYYTMCCTGLKISDCKDLEGVTEVPDA